MNLLRCRMIRPSNPLVGRESEYQQLRAWLLSAERRLITLTGASGVGKTHLAQHVVYDLAEAGAGADGTASAGFAHDIVYVSLSESRVTTSNLSADDALALVIIEALSLEVSGESPLLAQVCAYLQQRDMLLILDDLEELPTAGMAVSDLLRAAAGLHILASSLEGLNLAEEHLLVLQGLPTELPDNDMPDAKKSRPAAVTLFIQVAARRLAHFSPSATDGSTILHICKLLSGLPLAIELAAQWTHVLSCEEIAIELERNLDFLSNRAPGVPERHRNLRAVYSYSTHLLSSPEQTALRQLSVFPTSFSREAADQVAAVGVSALASLMDKSLLRRSTANANGGAIRYELPSLIRQFAREALTDTNQIEVLQQWHAEHYLALVVQCTAQLRGPNQIDALNILQSEGLNVRAAWHWAMRYGRIEMVVAAADALFHFYDIRSWFGQGASEFGDAVQALAARRDEMLASLALAKLTARQAWFLFHLGEVQRAQALFEHAIDAMRTEQAVSELIFPLNYLGALCIYSGDYSRAASSSSEGLQLASQVGDEYGQAIACNILGQIAYEQGNYTVARDWSERSLRLETAAGNQWSMAFSLTNLGKVAYATGDFALATRLFRESLRIRTALADRRGIAICLNRIGDAAMAQAKPSEAIDLFCESLKLSRDVGNQWGAAASLLNLGWLAETAQIDQSAICLLREAIHISLQINAVPLAAKGISLAAPILQRAQQLEFAQSFQHVSHNISAQAILTQAECFLRWTSSRMIVSDIAVDQAIDEIRARLLTTASNMMTNPSDPVPTSKLTARETEILALTAQGLSDSQIAVKLVISRRTVSTHLTSIYGKLQVNSRTAATRVAMEMGGIIPNCICRQR